MITFFFRFSFKRYAWIKYLPEKNTTTKKKLAIRALFKFFYYYFIYFKYNENNYIKVFQVILLNFVSLRHTLIHSLNNEHTMVSETPLVSYWILFCSMSYVNARPIFTIICTVRLKSFTWKFSLCLFYVSALLISCDFLAHFFYEIVYHLRARILPTYENVMYFTCTLLIFWFSNFGLHELQFSAVYFLFEYFASNIRSLRTLCGKYTQFYCESDGIARNEEEEKINSGDHIQSPEKTV